MYTLLKSRDDVPAVLVRQPTTFTPPHSSSSRHSHRRLSSLQRVDTSNLNPSPRDAQLPIATYASVVPAEHRGRRRSTTISHTSSATPRSALDSSLLQPVQSPFDRESPRTSRSSICSDDDIFSAVDGELTPQSSVDNDYTYRSSPRQPRFRSRSRSRERPRPKSRTEDYPLSSTGRKRASWTPATSSSISQPRTIPDEARHSKSYSLDAPRGRERRRYNGMDEDEIKDNEHRDIDHHQSLRLPSALKTTPSPSPQPDKSERRRNSVHFADSQWDEGSSGAEKDERRVRFSDATAVGVFKMDD